VFKALRYGFVASVEGIPGLGIGASPVRHDKRRGSVVSDGPAHAAAGTTDPATSGLFTRFALDFAAHRAGSAIAVLEAGCTTAGQSLDLAALRADGHAVDVSYVDDESPATRAALAGRPDLGSAALGELRLLPLRPRSFDIVHCSLLLHRISNVEVVLGRLVASLRPGGLLMLRIADPCTAAGFLDRRTPEFLRRLAWRADMPGQPGPHPAVYEPIASAGGIEAFLSRHGLAVAHRDRASSAGWAGYGRDRLTTRLVTWMSRRRLGSEHDELRYVIRKPEDRFARLLQ
jgi:SAM-dependent methyltransferase